MTVTEERSLAELFDLLSHPRRRFVIHALQRSQRALDTTTLAKRIAAWESTASAAGASEPAADAVAVSLHHTHLPKLAEAGLLVYDETPGRVGTADRTSAGLLLDDKLQLERERMLAHDR